MVITGLFSNRPGVLISFEIGNYMFCFVFLGVDPILLPNHEKHESQDIWGAQQLRTGCLSILMFLAPLAEVTP